MRMVITVDIDVEESGYTEDQIRNDAANFAHDLIVNGAENEGIGLTLREVSFDIP